MIDLNEAVIQMKKAGQGCVRCVPMPNQSPIGGMYQIEILSNNNWKPIVENINQDIGMNLIRKTFNRTICG